MEKILMVAQSEECWGEMMVITQKEHVVSLW